MKKKPKSQTERFGPEPHDLTLDDLILFVQGWTDPRPDEQRALRTEAQFHDFLRRYGANPHRWTGPHPPDGYHLERELAGIEAAASGPDPRDAA